MMGLNEMAHFLSEKMKNDGERPSHIMRIESYHHQCIII